MDPVTAAIIGGAFGGVTGGQLGFNLASMGKQKKEQKALAQQQEELRIDSVKAQIGAQEQQTNLALGGAAKRPTAGLSPSFASAALTGNQSSNTPSAPALSGSSGTF